MCLFTEFTIKVFGWQNYVAFPSSSVICIYFSLVYSFQYSTPGGLVVILSGLVLYNLKLVPEGGTDQSVFSIGYWYNYGHSLFCEWRCCPAQDKDLELDDVGDDLPLINDNGHYQAININDT